MQFYHVDLFYKLGVGELKIKIIGIKI